MGPREREGDGAPTTVICLAGGPGRDAAYLGDLGGLDARHRLVIPDSRGTGASPPSPDPT
ncbi:alpha/beta hydrolase, partial [Streptomyces sp. UNOC14_S4]|nr:alpha/beta hydrolase [Streptomyces sp. UNOC14_S4]